MRHHAAFHLHTVKPDSFSTDYGMHLPQMARVEGSFDECFYLLDFSLTVKAATLIFIPGRCSAISSAKQGKSGSIYHLVIN